MNGIYTRQDALKQLHMVYHFSQEHAIRMLAVADQMGTTAEVAIGIGPVNVTVRSNGQPKYEIADGIPASAVAGRTETRYTGSEETNARPRAGRKGRSEMAAKTAAPAANGTVDYTVYAEKPITDTMQGFYEWLCQEVGDLDKMPANKVVALAGTLRMEYQASDFNVQRREARRAERAAEAKPSQAAPAPARRGRPAKAEAAKPAKGTTGKRGSTKPATAARRGTRGKATAVPF